MTIQEIKALPRTEEGIFDLKKVQADAGRRNIYQQSISVMKNIRMYYCLSITFSVLLRQVLKYPHY